MSKDYTPGRRAAGQPFEGGGRRADGPTPAGGRRAGGSEPTSRRAGAAGGRRAGGMPESVAGRKAALESGKKPKVSKNSTLHPKYKKKEVRKKDALEFKELMHITVNLMLGTAAAILLIFFALHLYMSSLAHQSAPVPSKDTVAAQVADLKKELGPAKAVSPVSHRASSWIDNKPDAYLSFKGYVFQLPAEAAALNMDELAASYQEYLTGDRFGELNGRLAHQELAEEGFGWSTARSATTMEYANAKVEMGKDLEVLDYVKAGLTPSLFNYGPFKIDSAFE